MEPILTADEMLFMSGNVAETNCDNLPSFDWPPQQSELQYCSLTSRGQINSPAAAASVPPLLPLLLHGDRHLPLRAPYGQPISEPAARKADPPAWTRPCYHGNGVSRPPVKKPLNAFMLYMKATRHQVLQEGQEKKSAAINRILGRRWLALPGSERTRFFDLAQKERLLHMQLHPGWSARDNYGKRKQPAGSPSRSEVICSQV